MREFVHLHVHSEYSLLDGAARVEFLPVKAKALGQPALAITDHGVMYGVVEFYKHCQATGVKPIIGCEVYVARRTRFDKAPRLDEDSYHLTLLAQNEEGYRNLIRLCSLGHLEGFYHKPRVDRDLLAANAKGLVALSGCLSGVVAEPLFRAQPDAAREAASFYRDVFGRENFYLELQDSGIEGQRQVNAQLVDLSRDLGLGLVATNDAHYIEQADAAAHDILLCIQTQKTFDDPNRLRFGSTEFYLKSGDEMWARFGDLPESLSNTLAIAERCEFAFDFGQVHLPLAPVPEGFDSETFLDKLCREGLQRRYPAPSPEEKTALDARLSQELAVIGELGFAGYFLIVWDFIRFAREKCIPVGPGRGSAAGSLVSYALHITDIDPLQNGLLFERFLNPERISFPDIDIDFCMRQRGKVINYVTEKYGRENVSQIITFGTMGAKAVIRDSGRALDLPFAEVDRIAKLVPNILNITLAEAQATSPELRQAKERDPRVAELLAVAERLEGLARHASTHAAGVVISPQPLTEMVPLYKSNKDEITTQYAMDDLEKIGLLKMDFLGLTTLTVLDDCQKLIAATQGETLDLDNLPLDDRETYELLGRGLTAGIFQFESRGMTDILRRVKPNRLGDLTALNALYRPGPIQGGMIDDFIARKTGRKKVSYDLPQLKDILEETYGVIVYQEQVMQIAASIAGFTLGEADVLRRAMGKKKHEEMVAMREKFLAGARQNGVPGAKAQKLFELMEQFAGYGFNKSHSAAYALIAYQTAYLKAHYPVEFMAALLTSEIGNQDKLTQYLNECRDMGIKILPPDINSSDLAFTPAGQSMRFGLTAIKNVGETAIDSVLSARWKLGRFDSLFQFCEHVDLRLLNKRVIESLIKAGALDSLGARRSQMTAVLDRAMELGQRRQREDASGQHGLFMAGAEAEPAPAIDLPDIPEWSEAERLAGEKEVLGFYVTGHPLEKHAARIASVARQDSSSLDSLDNEAPVTLAGILTSLRVRPSKKGDLWASGILEDMRGSVELLVFPQALQQLRGVLKPDAALLIKGRVRHEENARLKVVVNEARPLEAEVNGAKAELLIRVDLAQASESIMEEVEKLLAAYPGENPVVFELTRPGDFRARLRPRQTRGVKPEAALLGRLREICGEEAVLVEKQAAGNRE